MSPIIIFQYIYIFQVKIIPSSNNKKNSLFISHEESFLVRMRSNSFLFCIMRFFMSNGSKFEKYKPVNSRKITFLYPFLSSPPHSQTTVLVVSSISFYRHAIYVQASPAVSERASSDTVSEAQIKPGRPREPSRRSSRVVSLLTKPVVIGKTTGCQTSSDRVCQTQQARKSHSSCFCSLDIYFSPTNSTC